ncbi:hypothetical protein TRFO_24971 [Tritrichomonas foetus]|uniref:Uncharacterized protein n=1 Tax=Tritrichomonas foetus TaxID=1144522 RepID=A0A1J4K6V9_9EUKA|nr:hypothetical protein TRFO_24971 [Tritrichomonas foetus]|eukprot:OHT06923.1 hypothetical protein TRFO_24971 [Tritrichomonas foetus]
MPNDHIVIKKLFIDQLKFQNDDSWLSDSTQIIFRCSQIFSQCYFNFWFRFQFLKVFPQILDKQFEMFWKFGPTENFQNINELISRQDCTISLLAQSDKIRLAFRKGHSILIDFLAARISEILDIVFGKQQCDNDNVPSLCLFFLTTPCSAFTSKILDSPVFFQKMREFIYSDSNKEEIPVNGLIAFSRIMEFYIQNSNGFILKTFSLHEKYSESEDTSNITENNNQKNDEKNENQDDLISCSKHFFSRILSLISNSGVYSLLYYISDHGHQATIDYLEQIDASRLIFERIPENDDIVISRCLVLLTNLVSSGLPTSPLTRCLVDQDILEKILQIAITSKSQIVSSQAFSLLLETCGLFDEEENDEIDGSDDSYESNEDSHLVDDFLFEKIPTICDYIKNELPFCSAKAVATDLLVGLLLKVDEVPELIMSLASYLFHQMFETPTRSTLHCSVLALFEAILDKTIAIYDVCDIRPAIVDAFKRRDQIQASYWGHLHMIASRYLNSGMKLGNECEGWDEYVENEYQRIQDKIDADYGGPLPHESDTESDSDDFGFGTGSGNRFSLLKDDDEDDDIIIDDDYEEDDSEDDGEEEEEGNHNQNRNSGKNGDCNDAEDEEDDDDGFHSDGEEEDIDDKMTSIFQ